MDRFENIADLHDKILDLFLEYREKYNPNLTFMLRSANNNANKGYLNKGKWFLGGKNSIRTAFLENKEYEQDYFRFPIWLEINHKGELLLECNYRKTSIEFINTLPQKYRKPSKFFGQHSLSGNDLENDLKGLLNHLEVFQKDKNEILKEDNYTEISQEEFQKNLDYILKKRQELKEKRQNEFPLNIIKEGKSPVKVSIKNFSIENYYAIKNTAIPNLPKNAPWIFLTGNNGAGKSLVLQALAIGLYGNKEDTIVPKSRKTIIKVAYQSQKKVYVNNSKQASNIKPLPNLACFGPIRLDVQSEGAENKSSKRSTATYGLFGNYDVLLKNIETELKFSFYENKNKFQALVEMLKQVIPTLHEVEFDRDNRVIRYLERSKDSEEIYQAVSFSELATGIKSIIAMVGDIYLRFSSLMQKGVNTDKYLSPQDLYGIVIIDELDLHLHPKWQKNLPSLLSDVFPNIQFIASTHSAIPILGAPENSVLLRVNRNREDGVTVERLEHLEKQLKDLTPNLILSSEIFGLTDIFPITHDKSERIRTEDTMEELKENDEMMEALKSYMNTDKEDELLELFSK